MRAPLAEGRTCVSCDCEAGPRELIRKLGPDSAGAAVTLTVLRGGAAREIALRVGEKPLG